MSRLTRGAAVAVLASAALVAVQPVAAAATPGSREFVIAMANQAIRLHQSVVRGSVGEVYTPTVVDTDGSGAPFVRFDRTYRGLPVVGGDFIIHLTQAGAFRSAESGLAGPIQIDPTRHISADAAQRLARPRVRGTVTGSDQGRLFIDATSGRARLAWEVVVHSATVPNDLHVVLDAVSGAVLREDDGMDYATGQGYGSSVGLVAIDSTPKAGGGFTMTDPVRHSRVCDMANGSNPAGTCSDIFDADNTWGSVGAPEAAVDVQYATAMTLRYFAETFGQTCLVYSSPRVCATGDLQSHIHYRKDATKPYSPGAQWNPTRKEMYYGDTDATHPFVSLDVVGHEMGHGLAQALLPPTGLDRTGESAGLSEGNGDIIGTMVEFFAAEAHTNTADTPDYDMGEQAHYVPGTGYSPVRNMYEPSQGCWQPSIGTLDSHQSAGVVDHFFFNLAEGTGNTSYGTSTPCAGGAPMIGIGRSDAAEIWYYALKSHFVSNEVYVDAAAPDRTARAGTLAAATDRFGACSPEYRAVQAAWASAGVTGPDPVCGFTLLMVQNTGSVAPGGSVATHVSVVSTLRRSKTVADDVALSVSGLPAGVSATFTPASVNGTAGSDLVLTATDAAVVGTYRLTVTGDAGTLDPNGGFIRQTEAYTLTVGGPGCSATNANQIDIPDQTPGTTPDLHPVTSHNVITGCDGEASATSRVAVHITHTYPGDLDIVLVSPHNTFYPLTFTPSDQDLDMVFSVDLSGETADGDWSLVVTDSAAGDVGTLDRWTVSLADAPDTTCTQANDTNVPIADLATASSSVTVPASCAGHASVVSTVDVDILHTYVGDLIVSLKPPGTGSQVYVLQDREGGSSHDIHAVFTIDLSAEGAAGTWTLQVQDAASGDVGTIDRWELNLGG